MCVLSSPIVGTKVVGSWLGVVSARSSTRVFSLKKEFVHVSVHHTERLRLILLINKYRKMRFRFGLGHMHVVPIGLSGILPTPTGSTCITKRHEQLSQRHKAIGGRDRCRQRRRRRRQPRHRQHIPETRRFHCGLFRRRTQRPRGPPPEQPGEGQGPARPQAEPHRRHAAGRRHSFQDEHRPQEEELPPPLAAVPVRLRWQHRGHRARRCELSSKAVGHLYGSIIYMPRFNLMKIDAFICPSGGHPRSGSHQEKKARK